MHTCRLYLGLESNFSRKVEVSLSNDIGLKYSENYKNTVLKGIEEIINGRIRFNYKRLWIITNGSFRFGNTSYPGTALREVVLNSEFACKFGKDDRGSLGIHFNDIFNQVKSFNVFMENDYIRTERSFILGRNAYLKMSYKF